MQQWQQRILQSDSRLPEARLDLALRSVFGEFSHSRCSGEMRRAAASVRPLRLSGFLTIELFLVLLLAFLFNLIGEHGARARRCCSFTESEASASAAAKRRFWSGVALSLRASASAEIPLRRPAHDVADGEGLRCVRCTSPGCRPVHRSIAARSARKSAILPELSSCWVVLRCAAARWPARVPGKRDQQVDALLRLLCALPHLIHFASVQRVMTRLCPGGGAEPDQKANEKERCRIFTASSPVRCLRRQCQRSRAAVCRAALPIRTATAKVVAGLQNQAYAQHPSCDRMSRRRSISVAFSFLLRLQRAIHRAPGVMQRNVDCVVG